MPKQIKDFKNTSLMTKFLIERLATKEFQSVLSAKTERAYLFLTHKYIKNPGRKWWQFWKPKKIKNPDYDPTPRPITIKRPVYH
jgi:hypothetical protein